MGHCEDIQTKLGGSTSEINYLKKEFSTTNICVINYSASLILEWKITLQGSFMDYIKNIFQIKTVLQGEKKKYFRK